MMMSKSRQQYAPPVKKAGGSLITTPRMQNGARFLQHTDTRTRFVVARPSREHVQYLAPRPDSGFSSIQRRSSDCFQRLSCKAGEKPGASVKIPDLAEFLAKRDYTGRAVQVDPRLTRVRLTACLWSVQGVFMGYVGVCRGCLGCV
jgi:hypothetical protein